MVRGRGRLMLSSVVAIALILSAVFIPVAFLGGISGEIYRQFALTIAVSTLLSTFNSLTLSPALTALLLRPSDKETTPPLPRLAFPLAGGWLAWAFWSAPLQIGVERALLPLSANVIGGRITLSK